MDPNEMPSLQTNSELQESEKVTEGEELNSKENVEERSLGVEVGVKACEKDANTVTESTENSTPPVIEENGEVAELPQKTEELTRELLELIEKFNAVQSEVLSLNSKQKRLEEISSTLSNKRNQDMLAIREEQVKLVADFEKNSAELWNDNNNEFNELATRMRNLEEKFTDADKRFGKLESLLEEEKVGTYWMEGKTQNKTPLVKEKPDHVCQMLPNFLKVTLLFTCALNYADTVTDIITAADMFRNEKYVLGSLSLGVMILVGVWIPFHTRSLTQSDETEEKFKGKMTWKSILAALTLSSTQYFILKKFLLKHPEGKYGRRKCVRYNNIQCRTEKCNNLRHKMRQLHEGVILEKMCENLPQFILQIINIAPEYLSPTVTVSGFWQYWKLVSLLLTTFSLARACVKFDFFRLDMNPRLFSFYMIGTGWKALYPQKYLLVIVHSTAIACKGLSVVFLIMLVNHNFAEDKDLGWCTLTTVLKDVHSDFQSNCYFETKVTGLIFLYLLTYYVGISILIISVLPLVYKHSIKNTLSTIKTVGSRFRYVLRFIRNLWWMYVMNFVVQHRHFMSDFTNHLPNVECAIFKMKVGPSILQALGTVIFTLIFYIKGDSSFNNVHLGITPFHLALMGIVIEAIHLISLLAMVYWADPQHVQSLSDEKIAEFLIRKGIVDEAVDVSCSRNAKDIIREIIGRNESNIGVYKEDIQEEMIGYSRQLPPENRVKGIAEFHRTFAEAIRKCSGVNKSKPKNYTPLQQDDEQKIAEVSNDKSEVVDIELAVRA